jgi:hypothetical protein
MKKCDTALAPEDCLKTRKGIHHPLTAGVFYRLMNGRPATTVPRERLLHPVQRPAPRPHGAELTTRFAVCSSRSGGDPISTPLTISAYTVDSSSSEEHHGSVAPSSHRCTRPGDVRLRPARAAAELHLVHIGRLTVPFSLQATTTLVTRSPSATRNRGRSGSTRSGALPPPPRLKPVKALLASPSITWKTTGP